MGQLNVGTVVECKREDDDDDEYELCTVKALDSKTGLLVLAFNDGFVRKGVPVQDVKIIEGNLTPKEAPPLPAAIQEEVIKSADALPGGLHKVTDAPAANGGSSSPPSAASDQALEPADQAAYAELIGPRLPAPPTAEVLAATPDAKYAFIATYKDVGNTLFKAGKYAWAIKTYMAAVDALAQHCYESRERMLWDYFARTPCGQCYSNAALCALKLGDSAKAARLCEAAMTCRPEDTDLVKVLLRHGQALLALGHAEAAKGLLEKAADKEPQNRAVREELIKAKRSVIEKAKEAEKALFREVNLTEKGLTSKKDAMIEQLQDHLDAGFDALLAHEDAKALRHLSPLIEGKTAEAKHRLPTTMLASYGVGIARYQMQHHTEEAIAALRAAFRLRDELAGDAPEPLMGWPIARFYYAHSLFETQKLREAKVQALAYLDDVAAAGPQKILNMPSGMLGRVVKDNERAASRFKVRACSTEAQCDAYTMLAIVSERIDGPAAAVEYFEKCLACGNEKQQADAHDNLQNTYLGLNDKAKAAEHAELAQALRDKIAADEEAAAKKRAEEAAAADAKIDDETEGPKGADAYEPEPVNMAEPEPVDIA